MSGSTGRRTGRLGSRDDGYARRGAMARGAFEPLELQGERVDHGARLEVALLVARGAPGVALGLGLGETRFQHGDLGVARGGARVARLWVHRPTLRDAEIAVLKARL